MIPHSDWICSLFHKGESQNHGRWQFWCHGWVGISLSDCRKYWFAWKGNYDWNDTQGSQGKATWNALLLLVAGLKWSVVTNCWYRIIENLCFKGNNDKANPESILFKRQAQVIAASSRINPSPGKSGWHDITIIEPTHTLPPSFPTQKTVPCSRVYWSVSWINGVNSNPIELIETLQRSWAIFDP